MGTERLNLIKTADIDVAPRIIDLVTSFPRNWEALQQIWGITDPIKKEPGTLLQTKRVTGSLNETPVGEGEFINRSKYTVETEDVEKLTIEKYAKEVSIEAVEEHGYDDACGITDEEFQYDLQSEVMTRFYSHLADGELAVEADSFQMAFAKTIGAVKNKWKTMHRTVTAISVFVNILDFYDYLGASEITVQTAFGMTYVQNFMGADVVFLCGEEEVPRNKMYATPVNNIKPYYTDPSSSHYAKMGLNYYVYGETPLVGFAIKGDYDHATSVTYALMGFRLLTEYIDGIAVTTIKNS